MQTNANEIFRLQRVEEVTGLKRASLYNRFSTASKYYDPEFPKPLKLGNGRAIGFIANEVYEWVHKQALERDL